jgi:uncharacterized protein (DUF427 family)
MGLAWQQGPLATGSVGHFLIEQPLPPRLLFAEPLRRRMRVRFADRWIADSEDVILLHEPGRYPVAYFPLGDIEAGILIAENRVTQHHDLGDTQWFTIKVSEREANHSAWHTRACHNMRRFSTGGWHSPGAPWTPSTKKTNASSGMPPMPITASISVLLHDILSSGTASR